MDSVLKTNLLCDILNVASIPLVRERNILNKCYNELQEEFYEEIPSHSPSPNSSAQGSVASSSITDIHSSTIGTTSGSMASDSGCDVSSGARTDEMHEPINEETTSTTSSKKKQPTRICKFKKPLKRANLSYKVIFLLNLIK